MSNIEYEIYAACSVLRTGRRLRSADTLQFILLEVAIDGLGGVLNTPVAGDTVSVIGALILGEFSVNSGWFASDLHTVYGGGGSRQFHSPSRTQPFTAQIRKDTDASRSGPPWGMGILHTRRHHLSMIFLTTKTLSGDLSALWFVKWKSLKDQLQQ